MIELPDIKGRRIRLTRMGNDPDPIPVGTEGTVTSVSPMPDNEYQVSVKWDNGRTLNLICPEDKYQVLGE